MPKFDWTAARVELISKLWRDGYAASEIARRLETTRGAVLGKLFRLGMIKKGRATGRKAVSRAEFNKAHQNTCKPNGIRFCLGGTLPLPKLEGASIPCTYYLTELEQDQCRYSGSERDGKHLFCGRPRVMGSPYCCDHHAVCYVRLPVKEREKEREIA